MIDEEKIEKMVIDNAIDSWRFSRLFIKVANKLDAGEAAKYISQLRYFQKKIDDNLNELGLKIVVLEGHPFNAGLAVSVINMEDFEPNDVLVIDQVIEPIVMGADGLKRSGSVTVKKVST
jgi:hypothetical protein